MGGGFGIPKSLTSKWLSQTRKKHFIEAPATPAPDLRESKVLEWRAARAHIRRPRPDWAARPALMRRAAHAVASKVVVRTEVAVSPRPCLGCAVELVLRVAPLRRGVPPW
jgi:hypothetical protein